MCAWLLVQSWPDRLARGLTCWLMAKALESHGKRVSDLGNGPHQVPAQNGKDDPDSVGSVDWPDVLQSLPDDRGCSGSVPVGLGCEMPLIVVGAPYENG